MRRVTFIFALLICFSGCVFAAENKDFVSTDKVMEVLGITDKPVPVYNLSYDWSTVPEEEQAYIDAVNHNAEAFYCVSNNTVYIKPNSRPGVVAHEITHAVLTNVFCEPLPEKIQEILAGYVEYSLFVRESK